MWSSGLSVCQLTSDGTPSDTDQCFAARRKATGFALKKKLKTKRKPNVKVDQQSAEVFVKTIHKLQTTQSNQEDEHEAESAAVL